MRQETSSNLQQPGTQRTGREQQEERTQPLQQPNREEVSLDNDDLEQREQEQNPGRTNQDNPGRTPERSDRRL